MGGGKKSSLTLYFAKELLSSAWPVLFWLSLSYAFWRGHGLLVLADWTSQCCELEWHSVMDDLPHAALAKSLALCCRVFLTVKIHTALAKTGSFPLSLLLKPNAAETFFFFTAMFKAVRVQPWFVSPEVPPRLSTLWNPAWEGRVRIGSALPDGQ